MVGALEVELIGNGEGLSTFLTVLGPVLIASAAVAAAFIARKTANERQEKQLAHDTERQEVALAHDRALRDREYLRETVSSVLENAINMTRATFDLEVALQKIATQSEAQQLNDVDVEAHDRIEKASLKAREDHATARRESHQASLVTVTDNVRLRALLGKEHPIVESHLQLVDAYEAWHNAFSSSEMPRTEEQEAKAAAAAGEVGPALGNFEDVFRAEFDGPGP
jgi:hypothetical protein